MGYRIEKRERLKEAFARIAVEEIASTLNELRTRNRNSDAIHKARKTIRRLRALLRLFRFAFHLEWFRSKNHRLRDAARKMSPLRDLRIQLNTLSELKPNSRIGRRVRRRLVHRETFLNRDMPGLRETVRQMVQTVGQHFAEQQFHHFTSRDLVKGLTRIYRQGRKTFKMASEDPSSENLHKLRKRTKSVRYAFQLIEHLGVPRISRSIKRAEKLSDVLGEHHDLFMLKMALDRENRARPAPGYRSLTTRIDAHRDKLQKKACKIGARLYDETPSCRKKRLKRSLPRE